jgi:signal transduction histidine kinase
MSEEVRSKIFEPFYSEKRNQESSHGMGLGLAISKQCVESFHGALECESAAGEGSVFSIEIPLGDADSTEGANHGIPPSLDRRR